MPQKRNNAKQPPPVMTWPKASPVLVVAGIFDALRFMFQQFWFFGPALATVYCTASVSDKIGSLGGAAALGCGMVAGTVGYFGAPAITMFGVVMAMAVGLAGWLTVGLIIILTNARIFKENEDHALWFGLSLLISEVPIIGSLPGLTGFSWKMYSAQIKKDKENLEKYKKEQAEKQAQEQKQKMLEFQQSQQEEIPEEVREAA